MELIMGDDRKRYTILHLRGKGRTLRKRMAVNLRRW
jgi:hypothetical protein